jgi:hypothetical protein
MKAHFISVALAALVLTSAVSANELFVTSAKSGSGQAFALDINSDGSATALQIRIAVGENMKVDLSKCVSGLPSTHTGVCAYRNGRVTVLVHSDTNEMLPVGLLSIGSIAYSGTAEKGLSVVELLAFDRNGQEVAISSEHHLRHVQGIAK